jgi:hypothetical protein
VAGHEQKAQALDVNRQSLAVSSGTVPWAKVIAASVPTSLDTIRSFLRLFVADTIPQHIISDLSHVFIFIWGVSFDLPQFLYLCMSETKRACTHRLSISFVQPAGRHFPRCIMWHSNTMELLCDADYDPFDIVTFTRVRDDDGEPTDLVEIEGLRQGGMRTRIVPYARLLDQADMHWEFSHGKSANDPMNATAFAHTMIRAAVAMLID